MQGPEGPGGRRRPGGPDSACRAAARDDLRRRRGGEELGRMGGVGGQGGHRFGPPPPDRDRVAVDGRSGRARRPQAAAARHWRRHARAPGPPHSSRRKIRACGRGPGGMPARQDRPNRAARAAMCPVPAVFEAAARGRGGRPARRTGSAQGPAKPGGIGEIARPAQAKSGCGAPGFRAGGGGGRIRRQCPERLRPRAAPRRPPPSPSACAGAHPIVVLSLSLISPTPSLSRPSAMASMRVTNLHVSDAMASRSAAAAPLSV